MNYEAIITTTIKELKNDLVEKYEFTLKTKNDVIEIYENKNNLFVYGPNLTNLINYIHDNFFYGKIINIGKAKVLDNIEIKEADIMLPNVFIKENEDIPFFLDNSIGGNYDLKKFGLVLNGICLTAQDSKSSQDYEADVIDDEIYEYLMIINENDNLENCYVIKIINSEKKEDLQNSLLILDIIL